LQEAVVFFISIPIASWFFSVSISIAFWFFSVSISSTGKSWAWKKEKELEEGFKKEKRKRQGKKEK